MHSLDTGTYKFELSATGKPALTGRDTVSIFVVSGDNAPVVMAGSDIYLVLPDNSCILRASVFGTGITQSVVWKKISGPAHFVIEDPSSTYTKVRDLVNGIYTFEITVTDIAGLKGKDTITVNVLEEHKDELIFQNLHWIFPWYSSIEIKNILGYAPPQKVFIQRDFDTSWIEVNQISNTHSSEYEYFIETRPDGAGMYTYGSLYIFYYGNITTDRPNVKIQF